MPIAFFFLKKKECLLFICFFKKLSPMQKVEGSIFYNIVENLVYAYDVCSNLSILLKINISINQHQNNEIR